MAKATSGNPATEVGQHTPEEYAGDGPRLRRRLRFGNGNK